MSEIKNVEQPIVNQEASSILEQAEVNPEQVTEKKSETAVTEQKTQLPSDFVLPSTPQAPLTQPSSEIELKKVESILSQGLESMFLSMDAATQVTFKQKGEQTAKEVNNLLSSGKAKLQKIIDLIVSWLKIIPQVNQHFLEQEAKIKADEILRLYNK